MGRGGLVLQEIQAVREVKKGALLLLSGVFFSGITHSPGYFQTKSVVTS